VSRPRERGVGGERRWRRDAGRRVSSGATSGGGGDGDDSCRGGDGIRMTKSGLPAASGTVRARSPRAFESTKHGSPLSRSLSSLTLLLPSRRDTHTRAHGSRAEARRRRTDGHAERDRRETRKRTRLPRHVSTYCFEAPNVTTQPIT